jgi:hypothetical protein
MLFHYITTKLLIKPKRLVIYCDNCKGQNRNKTLMHFLYWMVHIKNWFEEVEVNFLIVGHTKFSADRHFGYGKSKIKELDSLESI